MTTNDTFRKEIRYDRATGDFAAYLDDNYIGHFANHHEAEVALDQVAYDLLMDGQALTAQALDGGSDADTMAEEVAAAVGAPETTMVSIVEPGLVDANIQVWPHSTVELVERQPTANIWYALLVDGRYHNLVMKKHTIGRDYLISALNRALGQVEAAIEALNPQPAEPTPTPRCPYCDDTGLIPNGSGTGDQSGGWADTCACQDRRDPPVDDPSPMPPPWEHSDDDYGDALAEGAMGTYNGRTTIDPPAPAPEPTPEPAPAPQPPYGPQRPFPLTLSDTAELAAEISAVDGMALAEARALAQAHLQRVTHGAGPVCTNCGGYGHMAIDCPYPALPLPKPRPRGPKPIVCGALLAEADRVMAEVSYAAERLLAA